MDRQPKPVPWRGPWGEEIPTSALGRAPRHRSFRGLLRQGRRHDLDEAAQEMTKTPAEELEIGFGLPQDRKNALDIVKVARHAIDGKGALETTGTFVPEGMVTDRVKGQGMVYPTYVYATQIVEVYDELMKERENTPLAK